MHHLNSFINENPVRTFTSYFRLHAPDEWAPQNLQAYGVEIHPYNPDQDKGIGLPSDGAWVANVKVECRDKFRAAYDGRLRVKEATGLFQIGSVSAEKTISPRACVIEGQRESTVDVAGYKPYLLDVRNLPRFLNAQKRAGASWSSATIIRDAAYWYHVSAEASTQHVRLISLWTVLELLIDVHGGSIAERVFRYVPPFLVLYYVPLLVDYLMSELAELAGGKDDQSIKQAAVTAAGYGGNAKAAFAKYIVDNVEDIELLLGNRDVPRRFLRLFVGLMNEKGQLTDHLEKYNHEVICDLRRSYRYRNWLVHRVVVTSHTLDRTVERLEFYVRTVINGILMGLTVSPSLDVQDVIISRSETCHHYLGLCNNHRPIDIIEDVVSPRFLYL